MQGIYNYNPEKNHISRVHSVAAVLFLQFVIHVMLYRPRNVCIYYYYAHDLSLRSSDSTYLVSSLTYLVF
jgi:hypothetical protein